MSVVFSGVHPGSMCRGAVHERCGDPVEDAISLNRDLTSYAEKLECDIRNCDELMLDLFIRRSLIENRVRELSFRTDLHENARSDCGDHLNHDELKLLKKKVGELASENCRLSRILSKVRFQVKCLTDVLDGSEFGSPSVARSTRASGKLDGVDTADSPGGRGLVFSYFDPRPNAADILGESVTGQIDDLLYCVVKYNEMKIADMSRSLIDRKMKNKCLAVDGRFISIENENLCEKNKRLEAMIRDMKDVRADLSHMRYVAYLQDEEIKSKTSDIAELEERIGKFVSLERSSRSLESVLVDLKALEVEVSELRRRELAHRSDLARNSEEVRRNTEAAIELVSKVREISDMHGALKESVEIWRASDSRMSAVLNAIRAVCDAISVDLRGAIDAASGIAAGIGKMKTSSLSELRRAREEGTRASLELERAIMSGDAGGTLFFLGKERRFLVEENVRLKDEIDRLRKESVGEAASKYASLRRKFCSLKRKAEERCSRERRCAERSIMAKEESVEALRREAAALAHKLEVVESAHKSDTENYSIRMRELSEKLEKRDRKIRACTKEIEELGRIKEGYVELRGIKRAEQAREAPSGTK